MTPCRSSGIYYIVRVMKKFLILLPVIMALLLFGCKKEDGASQSANLSGTTWENNDGNVKTVMSFTSLQVSVSFQGGSTFYYSYEYDDPIVLMYPEDEEKSSLKGIISGNQMSIVNLSYGKTIGIFIKQ